MKGNHLIDTTDHGFIIGLSDLGKVYAAWYWIALDKWWADRAIQIHLEGGVFYDH